MWRRPGAIALDVHHAAAVVRKVAGQQEFRRGHDPRRSAQDWNLGDDAGSVGQHGAEQKMGAVGEETDCGELALFVSQLNRLTAGDLLEPQFALATAIAHVDDELAIGRQRADGISVAIIGRNPGEFADRERAAAAVSVHPERSECECDCRGRNGGPPPLAPRGRCGCDGARKAARFGFIAQFFERQLHVGHVLAAACDVFPQAAADEALELGRHGFGNGADGFGLFFDNRGQSGHARFAAEGAAAGDHFIEDGAEGEDVAARIDGLAFGLLGRHVRDAAEQYAFFGAKLRGNDGLRGGFGPGGHGGGGEFGKTEVEDFDAAVRIDHDVRWLQVAVDNARGVRCGERISDLRADTQRVREAHAFARDQVVEGLAFDQFHDDEGLAVMLANFVNRDDVGVIQAGGGAGFLQEAVAAARSVRGRSGRSLIATRRSRRLSWALYTRPMPPSPIFSNKEKCPAGPSPCEAYGIAKRASRACGLRHPVETKPATGVYRVGCFPQRVKVER